MRPLIIFGVGGLGREILGIIDAMNSETARWEVIGFADDSPSASDVDTIALLDLPLLGSIRTAADDHPGAAITIGIGSPVLRAAVVAELSQPVDRFPALIHPEATIGRQVTTGPGCIIAPGARLSTGIRLDAHVHIDQNVTIGHDTVIGACSRLNPSSCISGGVTIGARTLVGANATVLQGRSVADDVIVGAGAVVTRNVGPGTTVKGVPAR